VRDDDAAELHLTAADCIDDGTVLPGFSLASARRFDGLAR
jgi:hypothetical protein